MRAQREITVRRSGMKPQSGTWFLLIEVDQKKKKYKFRFGPSWWWLSCYCPRPICKNSFSLSSSLYLFYLAQTYIGLLYYFFSVTRAVCQSPGLLLPVVPLQPEPPASWFPTPPPPPQPLVSFMAAKSASLRCLSLFQLCSTHPAKSISWLPSWPKAAIAKILMVPFVRKKHREAWYKWKLPETWKQGNGRNKAET